MNSKQHKKLPNSWLLPILIFAFVWLLMGELISLHQKAIFDFYVFDQHPFSTPDKPGTVNVHQVKSKKSGKDQVEIDHHFTACLTDTHPGIILEFTEYSHPETSVPFFIDESYRFKATRAPPAV